MSLVNAIIKSYLRPRISRIEYAVSNPHRIQENTLRYLLHMARNTEWGRLHRYASIRQAEQYALQVPLQHYDTIKPYILRTFNGEQNILWPSSIRWFSKSSGTTEDRSKFIPVSRQALAYTHYRAGKDIMALYVKNNPRTPIFDGKCLVLTGSVSPNPENGRAYSGDVSGVLIENMDRWVHHFRTPSKEVALIPDWEEKLDRLCRATAGVNVTYLSGVPSWMLVFANRILEYTGKKDLREVWPGLELFIHGAVSFTPYRDQFTQLISWPGMKYYESYNASEGFFAIQDRDEPGQMLLMMDYGIYYEFLPLEELDAEHPRTLRLHEVEPDKNYALVISTNAGLWRYMLGDTIKFTSVRPYRIAITGRTKHFINAFGEELVVENTDKAVAYASRQTGASVKDYTVAPVYLSGKQAGAHEWLVEFDQPPVDIELFTSLLDDKLKEINSDYDAKRRGNLTLGPPMLRVLPPQTFYTWLKKRGKLGGQHKVPRLSNDRQYVEEITDLAGLRKDEEPTGR